MARGVLFGDAPPEDEDYGQTRRRSHPGGVGRSELGRELVAGERPSLRSVAISGALWLTAGVVVVGAAKSRFHSEKPVPFLRTPSSVIVLLLLFGASGACPLAASADGSTLSTPTLRITRLEPLIVKGVGFKPSEHVRVTGFVNQTKVAITVRPSSAGTFTISLGNDVHLEGCSAGASLKAVGSRGGVAILKIPPRACAQ